MDHIFGDSDDISFGSNGSTQARSPRESQPARAPRESFSRPAPVSRPPRESQPVRPSRPRSTQSHDVTIVDNTPALSRLIAGMKSSFLPREEDSADIRLVALSHHTSADPLFLMRSDDTTILVGSGFGSITRAGRDYVTFPDMRLIFSEKDRIRAWILTDTNIDVTRFEHILPTLGFPPIYATRDIIALFRNNIKNTEFLESCRFFELFADVSTSRRIGDIECILADNDIAPALGFRAKSSSFIFPHLTISSADIASKLALECDITTDGFKFGADTFIPGEVVSLKS